MPKKLGKSILAAVAANILEGGSAQEFARLAQQGLPYFPTAGCCVSVVANTDKTLPVERWTNLDYSPLLMLVMAHDTVTMNLISSLWLLEIARGYAWHQDEDRGQVHLIIIGEVAGDSFASLNKYGVIRYPSVIDILREINTQIGKESKDHLKKLWDESNWDGTTGVKASKVFEAYIRGALKARIVRSANTYISLP